MEVNRATPAPLAEDVFHLRRDEVQQLLIRGLRNGIDTFVLTFTGPDASGNIVSLTTVPIVYDTSSIAARNQTAADIAAALNALANIGGICGLVTVTWVGGGGPFGGIRFIVTFGGNLSQTNVNQMTGFPPPPPHSSVGTFCVLWSDGLPMSLVT